MKYNSKRIIAVALVGMLSIIPASVSMAEDMTEGASDYLQTEEGMNISDETPVLERKDIEIAPGQVEDLSADEQAALIMGMEEGTMIIKFKSNSNNQYQSLFSVSNATSGNQDRHFHLYISPDGTLGMELRNTDDEFKYTMKAGGAIDNNQNNIVAFKADKNNKEYKLFANGKLVSTLPEEVFKFFVDITDVDTIALGGTVRQGKTDYPFGGNIEHVRIYNSALSDDILLSETDNSIVIPEGVILEKENIDIVEGQGYSLNEEMGAEYAKALTQGTVILSYQSVSENGIQSLISMGNSTSGNQDRHFHIYVTNAGGVGMELRNTDGSFKYTLDRPAAVRSLYKGQRVYNTIAFKADRENKRYKLFADGELIAERSVEEFKFISDIMGVDNVTLGGTIRQGQMAYPFGGNIGKVSIHSDVLSDEELIAITGKTAYGNNIFYAGDATRANYFRIPSLLTLESGTILAAADARYGGTHDSKSKIDIAFAKSTDGGQTWSEPVMPLKFEDYVSKNIEWPRDSVGKNVQIQGSASYIDPVLLEDKETNRVFLFADLMPTGIGSSNAAVGSGFKEINDKKYLKLRWHEDKSSDFNYTIRENGVIYNDITGEATEYQVDGKYNLYQNGNQLTCRQYDYNFEGTNLLETKTDVDVNMNVFYKDSVFKAFPTNYIAMRYTDDEGETWSDLEIVSSFKPEQSKFLVVGPGVGKQISTGEYKGRLLVPLYSKSSAELGFMYSDDHGDTWTYIEADNNTGGATAEAQIVEMPDGSLKTYLRTGSSYIAEVSSIDGGETWSERVPLPGISTTSYGTQLSVINYSEPVDGKPALILSSPNATNGRKNGKIWIGLIEETGKTGVEKYTVDWKYCFSVDSAQMGYSYSCLTELPNGEIGLLYEKYDSWSRNELHLKNILKYETFTIDELKVNKAD